MTPGPESSTALTVVEAIALDAPDAIAPLGRRAVYAASLDPITRGHEWVIRNGAPLFDELHVALAVTPAKHYTFYLEERLGLVQQTIDGLPNVTLGHFDDKFTARYAKAGGYDYLLRGMRNVADFGDEQVVERLNHDIQEDVLSVYLLCPRELGEVSSSAVKSMVGPEGWEEVVSRYVSDFVLEALIKKHEARKTAPQVVPEPEPRGFRAVGSNVVSMVRRRRNRV